MKNTRQLEKLPGFFLYKENHALDAWFSRGYGGEHIQVCREERLKRGRTQWDTGKPPLCKGRCQPKRLTEGLLRSVGIREDFHGCSMAKQSPSQKSEIFASPLYTRGPYAAGRPYLRVDTLREEQRAMPAYEEPPVFGLPQFMRTAQKAPV